MNYDPWRDSEDNMYDYERALISQFNRGLRTGFCYGVAASCFIYIIGAWFGLWTTIEFSTPTLW